MKKKISDDDFLFKFSKLAIFIRDFHFYRLYIEKENWDGNHVYILPERKYQNENEKDIKHIKINLIDYYDK